MSSINPEIQKRLFEEEALPLKDNKNHAVQRNCRPLDFNDIGCLRPLGSFNDIKFHTFALF